MMGKMKRKLTGTLWDFKRILCHSLIWPTDGRRINFGFNLRDFKPIAGSVVRLNIASRFGHVNLQWTSMVNRLIQYKASLETDHPSINYLTILRSSREKIYRCSRSYRSNLSVSSRFQTTLIAAHVWRSDIGYRRVVVCILPICCGEPGQSERL